MDCRNFIVRSLVLSILFFAPSAMAQDTAAGAAVKTDDLIVKSGLQRQIGQLPEVVTASFEQQLRQDSSISAQEAAKIRQVIAETVTPAAMLESIKGHIHSHLDETQIDGILNWLNSPLGQRITKMEEDASSAEAYAAIQGFAMGLSGNPPDPARVEVLKELDNAAHMTEFSSDMKIDMIVNMTETMAAAAGRTDFNKQEVVSGLEGSRAQILEGSAQEILITGLYTYQGLTADELKQYVDFYRTEVGQKYAEVITQGLLEALNNSSRAMGDRLGKLIKEEKANDAKPAS